MSFEEPNNPRSSEIVNNQIQLTELAMYEERTPAIKKLKQKHGSGGRYHEAGLAG